MSIYGALPDDVCRRIVEGAVTAVHWEAAPKGASLAPLTDVASAIEILVVQANGGFDDSDAGSFVNLDHLDLLTKSKRPLDLSRLVKVRSVCVDDRPNLSGLAECPATHIRLAYTVRPLREFTGCTSLRNLTLESPRPHIVDLSAHLAGLVDLGILGGRVTSFEGLDAPDLTSLTVMVRRAGDIVDISPLLSLPSLTSLNLAGVLVPRTMVVAAKEALGDVWCRDLAD